jgi:hypothetical protein
MKKIFLVLLFFYSAACAVVYRDSFNRADESPIGSPWVSMYRLDGGIAIGSNVIKRPTGGTFGSFYNQSVNNDQYTQVKLATLSGNDDKVCLLRFTNSELDIHGYALRMRYSYDEIQIIRFAFTSGGSTDTTLKTISNTFASGQVVTFSASSTKLIVSVNGTKKDSVTDNNYTSGYAGGMIIATSSTYDDWECGDLTAPATGCDSSLTFPDTVKVTTTTAIVTDSLFCDSGKVILYHGTVKWDSVTAKKA